MRIQLDDDSACRQLSMVLRKAGHDVATPADLDISGAPDPVHLTRAIRVGRVLLTRNARDFTLLHDLVRASGGGHPGILLLHFDNDPTRDLNSRSVATAIAKLEASGVPISNELHVLNAEIRGRKFGDNFSDSFSFFPVISTSPSALRHLNLH